VCKYCINADIFREQTGGVERREEEFDLWYYESCVPRVLHFMGTEHRRGEERADKRVGLPDKV
jgi:transposase